MKIAVDLGHGLKVDRGLKGLIEEEELINSVGNVLIESLKNEGNIVIPVRPNTLISTIGQSLGSRVKLSNDYNADLFISLHGSIRKDSGAEAYTYKRNNSLIANRILNNLQEEGFANKGIKDGRNLYVIKNTVCHSILLQICAINSLYDLGIYKKRGPIKIAKAIAEGIMNKKIYYKNNDNSKKEIINKLYNILGISNKMDEKYILAKMPLIKFGDQGYIISLVQQIINVDCDGIYGNITRNAIIRLQKEKDIEVDGIIGINTWKALINI